MTLRILGFALVLATPLGASAEQAPSQSAAAPIVPSVAASIPVGSRVGVFPTGYEEGGRRDPFFSLVTPKRAATPAADGSRPRSGLAGMALADITVTGISKVGDSRLAILEGPNKQSYVARLRDRLSDAVVATIDADGVVFHEQIEGSRVTNPVRRSLRPVGEGVR